VSGGSPVGMVRVSALILSMAAAASKDMVIPHDVQHRAHCRQKHPPGGVCMLNSRCVCMSKRCLGKMMYSQCFLQ
jgi:hypothetical protein